MITLDSVVRIGLFNKPHGLKGEIGFSFDEPDLFDEADPSYIVCDIEGILVPFFIEDYRFRSDTSGLMVLDGINTDEAARGLTNRDIYISRDLVAEESCLNRSTGLIGYTIQDEFLGSIGTVLAIDQTTINTLLLVERNGEEIYIPFAEEFFPQYDEASKILYSKLPDGLIE